jgi:hypothetical protein
MAVLSPDLENIKRFKVPPTAGEWDLIVYLTENLDDSYEIFFNPYLDGDRPDIIILKEHCAAFIIEVKDWDLSCYSVNQKNKWKVFDGERSSNKPSPHSQVFRYKKNLYDLHLPIVGLERLVNPNFFNLVHCFVYFYNASQSGINGLYETAEEENKNVQSENNQDFKNGNLNFSAYEKNNQYLDRTKKMLQRDKGMSIGHDRLDNLVKKIKQKSAHVLFKDEIYQDFKRRLSPPEHTLNQGIPINFDKKQLTITKSKSIQSKIKGVAGCGKSTILAQRAINAYKRHGTPVLILTFNITLKNYIRDKISDIQGCRDFSIFEISNYHQFFNTQVNNTGQDISELIDRYGIEEIYSTDVFEDQEPIKYHTILVDEIQDYQSEWVKIVRDNFLSENGEIVLFGDESQNIYQREGGRSRVIAQGFGTWVKLNRSYRTDIDSPFNQLFKDFQVAFLVGKYADTELVEVNPVQIGMGFTLLKYEALLTDSWQEDVFNSIQSYIKSYSLHPNDIVILCSKIGLVRQLNDFWAGKEKTHCMFETYDELSAVTNQSADELIKLDEARIDDLVRQNKDAVERIRRVKKNHFYANSGLIKLSTIHSYKGLESKTVFYIMREDDDPEIVYTSVTRSSENLVVFDLGGKNLCSEFFQKNVA